MDITQFNKELGIKIAIAKRYEKNDDIKSAIKQWLEISEMTLNFSKSKNLDASFKNMLINKTKGIFKHIKNLKMGQFKEEVYIENYISEDEDAQIESRSDIAKIESKTLQEQESSEESTLDSSINNINHKIVQDSEFKNLPKGFKEIKTSKDFEIITPHDENFINKHMEQAKDMESKKLEGSEELNNSKNLICFACGYDKNSIKDKICKNCGTKLN
ncbi:MAG: hypothetical protein ACFE75_05140 [Candidatus Hodarchaeota archaeon]